MAEHNPQHFVDLFASEPSSPTDVEVAQWIDLYTQLVDLLETQLRDTETFAEGLPEALRQYLSRENGEFIRQEASAFRVRLAYWQSLLPREGVSAD